MGLSTTRIIGGPALVTFRGSTFYSQGDIKLDMSLATFNIEVDAYRKVDERVRAQPIKVSFVPAGAWNALNVLFSYATIPFGDLITPVRTLGPIANNQVNLPQHNLQSGDAVYVTNSGGALPTGLSAATLYYIHVVSSDAVTFHTTRALAISGSSPIAVSGGTGLNKLVVNNPLTIQTMDANNGQLITIYNAAVTKMPNIIGSAVKTLLAEVEFEGFIVDGQSPATANSYYSIVANPFAGDTSFNPANILTQPITLQWGNVAPWNSFFTKAGVTVEFNLQLEDIEIDGLGIITKRLAGLEVMARGQPFGMTESDLATAFLIQGAGAGIGRSLSAGGSNLILSAAGFYAVVFGAALKAGPEQFSSRLDRVGEVTWIATRTFNAGVPNPLFYVDNNSIS